MLILAGAGYSTQKFVEIDRSSAVLRGFRRELEENAAPVSKRSRINGRTQTAPNAQNVDSADSSKQAIHAVILLNQVRHIP